MSRLPMQGPQNTVLYKIIAAVLRLRPGYLMGKKGDHQILALFFLCAAGATALGTITLAAYLVEMPLLFPPLGPSAFILFYFPMSASASPRNVGLSHGLALCCGLLTLHLGAWLFPHAGLMDPDTLNGYRALVIAFSMGSISLLMVVLGCAHPPAAATALIAGMGYLVNPLQVVGFLIAVVLLVFEAIVFNRVLGGLPYPLWRFQPTVAIKYGQLAGVPDSETSFWHKMASRTFQHRRPRQEA